MLINQHIFQSNPSLFLSSKTNKEPRSLLQNISFKTKATDRIETENVSQTAVKNAIIRTRQLLPITTLLQKKKCFYSVLRSSERRRISKKKLRRDCWQHKKNCQIFGICSI